MNVINTMYKIITCIKDLYYMKFCRKNDHFYNLRVTQLALNKDIIIGDKFYVKSTRIGHILILGYIDPMTIIIYNYGNDPIIGSEQFVVVGITLLEELNYCKQLKYRGSDVRFLRILRMRLANSSKDSYKHELAIRMRVFEDPYNSW